MGEPALKLLTLDEAAAMLQTDRRTIRRAITAGRLRAVRLGEGPRSDRIHPDDLAAYIEGSKVGGERWQSEKEANPGRSMSRSAVYELGKRLGVEQPGQTPGGGRRR